MNTKDGPKLSQICSYEIFSKTFKDVFETAVVNESLAFEPLKFYCNSTVALFCLPPSTEKPALKENSFLEERTSFERAI